MKIKPFLLALSIFSSLVPLIAQPSGVFSGTFDFSKGVDAFYEGGINPGSTNYILNGLASEILRESSGTGNTYTLELVFSRWENRRELKTYRALIIFQGSDFDAVFPERVSSQAPSYVVGPKDQVRVIASFQGMREGVPLFRGRYIQKY